MRSLPPHTVEKIAKDLSLTTANLEAVIALLDSGAPAPFIARYRRDVTGGINETQVRGIRARVTNARDGSAIPNRGATKKYEAKARALLLEPPFGPQTVVGIAPSPDDAFHFAVVDPSGAVVEHGLAYTADVGNTLARTRLDLMRLIRVNRPAAFAIGPDQGAATTTAVVKEICAESARVSVVSVSFPGLDRYRSSEAALTELALPTRRAVELARRLQDPLASYVRVGARAVIDSEIPDDLLEELLESCVNQVGVDVNRAPPEQLRYVCGLKEESAGVIVDHRAQRGPYTSREQLRELLGDAAFLYAAGFLRVHGGTQPLDETAIHPERYPLVERIAAEHGIKLGDLVGQPRRVAQLEVDAFVSDSVGREGLEEILELLRTAHQDPRGLFAPSKIQSAKAPTRTDKSKSGAPRRDHPPRPQSDKRPARSGGQPGGGPRPDSRGKPQSGRDRDRSGFSNNPFADLKAKLKPKG